MELPLLYQDVVNGKKGEHMLSLDWTLRVYFNALDVFLSDVANGVVHNM